MPERKSIGQNPSTAGSRNPGCDEWERLILEALDGTLPAADLAVFERHGRECADCSRMLAETRQGVLWLGFLDREPEPPAGLLQKILAQTGGAVDSTLSGGVARASCEAGPVAWAPVGNRAAPASYRLRHLIEPHLLMTAAMAFFSLALTLNLTGVEMSKIDLSGLRPSVLSTYLTRQYYSANAQVVKYYEDLRFVYEMEARMRDLQQSFESQPAPEVAPEPPTQSPSSRSPVSWNGRAGSGQQATESTWTASLGDWHGAAYERGKRSLA